MTAHGKWRERLLAALKAPRWNLGPPGWEGRTLTSVQIWRRLNAWFEEEYDDALDRRCELRADRIQAEEAWLASPEGIAWRARIRRRLDRSREWLAPPTFDAMVRRHLELNEEQRLDPPPRIG